jgi:uncharacterized membrane protein
MTDTKDNNDIIYTPFFKVVPKVPTAVKAGAALVLIGGGVAAAGGSKGGGDGGGTPVSGDIPLPTLP